MGVDHSGTCKRINHDSKLRVLSLFAGIGGFDLGLERTGGFETVAFCEIEPYAQKVLAKHWPKVPIYEDVRTISSSILRSDGITIDVIVGGFPCQDISSQGFQAGITGERSGLWSEIARLAGELRPKIIIVENVSALLGNGMGTVLGDLASLGYDAEWHCIPASYLGASHERDRVWIIAHPAEINGGETIGEGSNLLAQRIARECAKIRGTAFCEHEGKSTIWLDGQSALCSKNDGLPYTLVKSQLERYGNAVVPQIPEAIGNAILERMAA